MSSRAAGRGKRNALSTVALAALLGLGGCASGDAPGSAAEPAQESSASRAREAYYLEVAGSSEPPELVSEVSRSEALSQDSYFRAQFDSSGALAALSKFRRGERLFRTEYYYYPDGTVREARVINRDGNLSVRRFDAQGRLLEESAQP